MKKNYKNVIATMTFGLTFLCVSAQEKEKKNESTFKQPSSLILIDANDGIQQKSSQTVFQKYLNLGSGNTHVSLERKTDQLGITHEKFQQTYNGLKVEFAKAVIDSKNGKTTALHGEYYNVKNIETTPKLSKDQALQKAIAHIGAEKYLWENPAASKAMDDYKAGGELLLLPDFDSKNEQGAIAKFNLAYKFDIYATKPLSRGYLYIDAHSGKALFYNAIIKHASNFGHVGERYATVANKTSVLEEKTANYESFMFVSGTASTRYSGTQTIETTLSGGSYTLNDAGRKVYTRDAKNQAPGSTYPYINNYDEFSDNDNNWTTSEHSANKDDAALDAHWGAAQTYDYWSSIHGRNSYDGNGAQIRSYVHVDSNYDNAFWNGSVMSYGDGSSNGNEGNGYFDALTSIDVAAHEIGHAVTTYTADLAYQRESGGINEGYSDIWGAAVEHFAKGNGSDTAPSEEVWLIGDEIDRRTGSAALRSMSDPTSLGQPDTYGGEYWQNPNCGTPTSSNDYCGVHTNSGVLNHWFYLATVGGSGTNDIGSSFTVSAIGMDKTAKIAFRTLNIYLSANSTYADARSSSIQATIDLYGAAGAEEISITNAWYAVGVGQEYGDTSISYCTSNGNSVSDEYISRVQLESIDNTSGATSGYSNHTDISTSLTTGDTYTITVTPTWTSTAYDEGYSVWIDYNQDGDFGDSGEQVWTQAASQTTPVNGSFTVPSDVASGETRMRVSMKYDGIPTACESFSYGEVEDYTIVIGGSTSDTEAPSTPSGLIASSVTETSLTLSWSAATDNVAVTGYDIYEGNNNIGTSPTATTNITGLTANTAYQFSIVAKDDAGNESAASNTLNVTTTGGETSTGDVILNITFDNYPEETSWEIIDDTNTVVFSGGTYASQADGSSITLSTNLDLGCYSLIFKDTYGDGICCSFGNGSYELTTASGTVLASGGSFNSEETTDFCIDTTNTVRAIQALTTTSTNITSSDAPSFRIHPNPASSILNVSMKGAINQEYVIFNTLGQTVDKGTISNSAINVDKLEPGMYILKVNTHSSRFIKQ